MKKTYTFEMEEVDGKMILTRRCDGFNGFELLGLLFTAQMEIIEQMKGTMSQPDIIKREIVK